MREREREVRWPGLVGVICQAQETSRNEVKNPHYTLHVYHVFGALLLLCRRFWTSGFRNRINLARLVREERAGFLVLSRLGRASNRLFLDGVERGHVRLG